MNTDLTAELIKNLIESKSLCEILPSPDLILNSTIHTKRFFALLDLNSNVQTPVNVIRKLNSISPLSAATISKEMLNSILCGRNYFETTFGGVYNVMFMQTDSLKKDYALESKSPASKKRKTTGTLVLHMW